MKQAMLYRPLAGGSAVYNAVVMHERPDGRLDLDVYVPGCSRPVSLSRIVRRETGTGCGPGECFPKLDC